MCPERTAKADFERHEADCQACGEFVRSHAGWLRLEELEDVEPPRNLLHNVVAAAGGLRNRCVRAELQPSVSNVPFARVGDGVCTDLTPRFPMLTGYGFCSL